MFPSESIARQRSGASGATAVDSEGVGVRLGTAIHLYLQSRRGELAPTTKRQLRWALYHAADFIGRDMLVRNLRRRHVELWLGSMEDLEVSSRRTQLARFKVFCRWMVISGHIKRDPTLGVKGPRVLPSIPRELPYESVVALLASVPNLRARLIVSLAVQEGLRRSEIAGLRREHVDLESRRFFVKGKGGTEAWLPLSDETHDALIDYFRETPGMTGFVLRSQAKPGQGLAPTTVGYYASKWMTEAGVKQHPHDGKSLHALRHTMAGAMLDDGADIRDVQDALRHRNLSATYLYLRRRQDPTRLAHVMGQRRYMGGDEDDAPAA